MDVRGFELSLRSSGYKADTIERAVRNARFYLMSCNGDDPAARESVERFLAEAAARVRRHTLLNYHKDLSMFFRWAMSKGLVSENPLNQIPRPRPSLYERERDTRFLPYSADEFEALLSACPFWNWLGRRDRAIVWLLWETPLRASELLALRDEDVDWAGLEVRVSDGKNGIRYEAAISVRCAEVLNEYIGERPPAATLFVDRHGGPLSRHALELLLRRLAKRAAWTKPCSPHLFRHNFRVRMRQEGLDDAAISALMGHATVVVTHGYARQAARQQAKEQRKRLLQR